MIKMINSRLALKIKLSLLSYTAWLVVATMLLFQKPLLQHAISVSDLFSLHGFVQLLSLQVLQFCLLFSAFLIVSIFSIYALKLVSSALFLLNSMALYFMQNYSVEIDISMIGNILNSDAKEIVEFYHISFLLFILAFGVLPGVIIWKVKVIMPRWYVRPLVALASMAALLAWLFLTSFTWLWYDSNASRLGSRILPWSYIVNIGRHYSKKSSKNRTQILLPDAIFNDDSGKKLVVALVIGEAARAKNLAYYGYQRDTNPFTRGKGMIAFPVGNACSTNTINSTACITTHEGREASSRTIYEPIQSYLTRHGVNTIYRTNTYGPPPFIVSKLDKTGDIINECKVEPCPNSKFEEILYWGIAKILEETNSNRIFLTLHQTGSHGPLYNKKYPEEFEYFTPVCKTVQIANCSREELVNGYDNTLRYSDSLLENLIIQLESLENTNAVLIYVSDHGESLGEGGYYLHGAPVAVAPPEQLEVPFLVWMSDGFRKSHRITEQSILPKETFPHDFPFHSIMGAFSMQSDIYKPQFDIFNFSSDGPSR